LHPEKKLVEAEGSEHQNLVNSIWEAFARLKKRSKFRRKSKGKEKRRKKIGGGGERKKRRKNIKDPGGYITILRKKHTNEKRGLGGEQRGVKKASGEKLGGKRGLLFFSGKVLESAIKIVITTEVEGDLGKAV